MKREDAVELLAALTATAEVMGTAISEGAARMMMSDLLAYPVPAVLAALVRCRRECKFRLTLAEIIERIDDGRPGAEEAWSIAPMSERQTAVVTEEIMAALPLAMIERGDMVAARMAFTESYRKLVAEARAAGKPVHWFASLGHDLESREKPLRDAERLGRLPSSTVAKLLPAPKGEARLPSDVSLALRRITG